MTATTLQDVQYLTQKGIHKCLESVLADVLEAKPENGLAALLEGVTKFATSNGAFEMPGSLEASLRASSEFLKQRPPNNAERNAVEPIFNAPGGVVPRRRTTQTMSNLRKMVQCVSADIHSRKESSQLTDAISKRSEAARMLLEVCLEMSSNQTDHMKLLKTLMEGSSQLLQADRCTFFLVEGSELVSKLAEGTTDEIRVPIGLGIAGCVAKTGEVINIPDVYSDDRFNKSIDLKTGYKTKSLICAPVHYQNNVIAVAQLLNKTPAVGQEPEAFTDSDLSLFEAFASFAGVFLANSYQYRQVALEKRKNEVLLEVVERVSKTDLHNWMSVADAVKDGCKELMQAERCTLFLVDKEQGTLYADSDGTEIRMPIDQGIAGFVCVRGETVNIPDAYCDPRFNPDVDDQTGFVTKTILCMPVWANGEVVAVAQVINKSSGQEFCSDDEDMLRFFAAFSGLHLANAKLLDFSRRAREETMRLLNSQSAGGMTAGNKETMSIKAATEEAAAEALRLRLYEDELDSICSETFNAHVYSMKGESHARLVPLGVYLFDQMGCLKDFDITQEKMARFLLTAFGKYRVVPYHNAVHAFDVLQNVFIFLKKGAAEKLTTLDGFVLMVSAVLHDVDHMGLNNSFHSKAETPLGLLSNATGASSALEVHHCNVAIAILAIEEIGIFSALAKEESVEAYKLLIHNILKTDMAMHESTMQSFAEISERGYNKDNLEDRRIASAVLLKAADLSNLAKPFNVSRLWGIAITTEFYLQGDSERAEGKQVTPGFDRHTKQELAQGQINFITYVGKKFYENVYKGIFPELRYLSEQVEANLGKWSSILRGET